MTARSKADAGVFTPAHLTRAMTGTALTAVLAVVFGVSVMVELANTAGPAPRADTPVVARHAASTPAPGLSAEPRPEGTAAAF
jgi:hypothetical protein